MESEVLDVFKRYWTNLLQRYKDLQVLDYKSFLKVWDQINFNEVYSKPSIKNFYRDRIAIYLFKGTEYFVRTTDVYMQVAALYALHQIYYSQNYEPKQGIRLTVDDHNILKELVRKMKEIKEKDFLYIYAKMVMDDAFWYVATNSDYDINLPKKLSREKDTKIIIENILRNIIYDSTIINNLRNTQNMYSTALQEYLAENPHLTFTMNKKNVVTELQDVCNKS